MPSKTQSILLGAATMAILSTSYLGLINVACCAGIILGAMAGVWHYTSENDLTIPPGTGATMGLLMGLLAVLIAFALNYLIGLVGLPDSAAVQAMIQGMFTPDPSEMSQEQIEQMEAMQEQWGGEPSVVITLLSGALINSIFGAIGGAIGAAVFKKGEDDGF